MGFRKRFLNIFSLVLVSSIFCSVGWTKEEDPNSFHLFFHAPGRDKQTDGYISVDAGTYASLDDAVAAQERYKNEGGQSLLPNGKREKMELVIVVPKDAPAAYVDQFVEETKAKFASQLGEYTKVIVKRSYIDADKNLAEMEATRSTLKQEIRNAPESQMPALKAAWKINEEDTQNLKTWRDRWIQGPRKWLSNPASRDTLAFGILMVKMGISSTMIITKYGLNVWSAGIGFVSGAIAGAFGYKAVEYSQWTQNHKLFLTKRFPVLEKLAPIKFYNDSPQFKSIAINFVRSTGISYLVRLSAHLSDQTIQSTGHAAPSPNNLEFFTQSLGMTAVELWGDSWADVGSRSLTQKRYLPYTSRSYIMWFIGLIDTTMHSLFRANALKAAYLTCGISMTFKSGLWVLSKVLQPRARQIVVVSGFIPRDSRDFEYVKKQGSLTEALRMSVETEERIRGSSEIGENLGAFAKALGMGHMPLTHTAEVRKHFHGGKNMVHSCSSFLGAN